jgi:hypothetical protein
MINGLSPRPVCFLLEINSRWVEQFLTAALQRETVYPERFNAARGFSFPEYLVQSAISTYYLYLNSVWRACKSPSFEPCQKAGNWGLIKPMTQLKRPKPPVIPLELWRELFHTAVCFQSLAPWQWMHDRHVLGIDDEHGVRLVSVIGNLREVFGLAIYRGSSGVNFLLRMLRGDTEPDHPDAPTKTIPFCWISFPERSCARRTFPLSRPSSLNRRTPN